MALILVNLTGFSRGVRQDEVGLNIKSIKSAVEPEFTEFLNGKDNARRGFAQGPMKLTATIEGEVNTGLTGIMAARIGTAVTLVNSVAYFGAPTTGLYLMKGDVTEARDGWLEMSCELEASAGIP
jgi:hypothetical protein